ncbi:MAG: M48 family metallopeptidase [Acidaminococcales bacterium]|jgi:predicted metal-dependent hydrolase|nr:M48 family metallopeptidase [Acidaminococcales bacterium]
MFFENFMAKARMDPDYRLAVTSGGDTYTIPIEYERKRRRQLILRVYPKTARVVFSVPLNTPDAYARDFFNRHKPWLEKQLQRILPLLAPKHTYLPGDVFYYLGEPLALACFPAEAERAEIAGGGIILRCRPDAPADRRRALLEKMFARLLPPLIDLSLARVLPLCAPFLDIAVPPAVKNRKMTSRWGVCRPFKNELCFSNRLAHLPPQLIDYVVAHELCHFKFLDHSQHFWRLLEKISPAWRECRQELNRLDAYIDV